MRKPGQRTDGAFWAFDGPGEPVPVTDPRLIELCEVLSALAPRWQEMNFSSLAEVAAAAGSTVQEILGYNPRVTSPTSIDLPCHWESTSFFDDAYYPHVWRGWDSPEDLPAKLAQEHRKLGGMHASAAVAYAEEGEGNLMGFVS